MLSINHFLFFIDNTKENIAKECLPLHRKTETGKSSSLSQSEVLKTACLSYKYKSTAFLSKRDIPVFSHTFLTFSLLRAFLNTLFNRSWFVLLMTLHSSDFRYISVVFSLLCPMDWLITDSGTFCCRAADAQE